MVAERFKVTSNQATERRGICTPLSFHFDCSHRRSRWSQGRPLDIVVSARANLADLADRFPPASHLRALSFRPRCPRSPALSAYLINRPECRADVRWRAGLRNVAPRRCPLRTWIRSHWRDRIGKTRALCCRSKARMRISYASCASHLTNNCQWSRKVLDF